MKLQWYKIIGLMLIIQIMNCCTDLKQTNKEKSQTFADSLWIDFAKAMENKNLDYLIQNSLDTIRCSELDSVIKKTDEFYNSEMIFKKHLKQLMHLNSLTDKKFSSFQNDSVIHINYSIKSKYSEEKGYNLIYTFVKTAKGFKLKGMTMT